MTARELGRALALLLVISLLLVAPSLTLTALDDAGLPWWWQVSQLAGYGAVAAVATRTVLTGHGLTVGHRLMWAVSLAASVTAPFAFAAGGPGGHGGAADLGRLTGSAAPDTVPLVAQVVPIAAAACAAGWRGWRALAPATLLTVAQGMAHASLAGSVSSYGPETWGALVEQAVFTLGVTMVSVIAVGAIRTSTDRLESTRADARRSVADAERGESRRLARVRWAASLHDDVLAVLSSVQAGQSPTVDDRGAASRALTTISTQDGSQRWTAAELADHIAHVVTRVSPGAVIASRASPGPVPPQIAEAVLAATTEAVRNVVRHARTDGRCHISVTAGGGGIEVTISDDGVGFVAGHVPLGRLGLRVAVRDRLRAVGGTAEWASSPGAGTTVTLRWSAPGPSAVDGTATGTDGRSPRTRRSSWSLPAR